MPTYVAKLKADRFDTLENPLFELQQRLIISHCVMRQAKDNLFIIITDAISDLNARKFFENVVGSLINQSYTLNVTTFVSVYL